MSKLIREVGFLALGVAAIIETLVYFRFWEWEHADGGISTAVFVLLLGIYFAQDGLAWSDLSHLLKQLPPSFPERKEIMTFAEACARRWSPYWLLDFVTLIFAAISLGLSILLLASYESHGIEPEARVRIFIAIGTSLTLMFALTAAYWFFLDWEKSENRPGAAGFVAQAGQIWRFGKKAHALKWILCIPFVVSAIFTGVAYTLEPATETTTAILQAAAGALFLLNLVYLLFRKRRERNANASVDAITHETTMTPPPEQEPPLKAEQPENPGTIPPGRWKWQNVDCCSFYAALSALGLLLVGIVWFLLEIEKNWPLRLIFLSFITVLAIALFRLANRVYWRKENKTAPQSNKSNSHTTDDEPRSGGGQRKGIDKSGNDASSNQREAAGDSQSTAEVQKQKITGEKGAAPK